MCSTTKHSSSSCSGIPTQWNLPVPYKCLSLTRNRRKWRNTFFAHLLVCQNSCSGCQHSLPSRLADFAGVSETQKPPTAWGEKKKVWMERRFTKAKQILVSCHHVEAHAGNPLHWCPFRSPVGGLGEKPCRDCSSLLVQPPGKMRQEAVRDPKYRLNCSLAFLLAAISASEDTSCQFLSQAVSHCRIIFLAYSPFLRYFSTGLASIFCQVPVLPVYPQSHLSSTLIPTSFSWLCEHFTAVVLMMHPISLNPFFLFLPFIQALSFLNPSLHTDVVPGYPCFSPVPVPLPWLFTRPWFSPACSLTPGVPTIQLY